MGMSLVKIKVFFLLILAVCGCGSFYSSESGVVRLKNNWAFPFVVLDFKSTALHIKEVDGEKLIKFGWIELPPGKHSLVIGVTKGPTGLFGPAPLLGTCSGKIEIEIIANNIYEVMFIRRKKEEFLQVRNRSNDSIVSEVLCVKNQ